MPSLFYGDEAGLQGYCDPFCRATYPWGNENTELLEFYRALGGVRRDCAAFKTGKFVPLVTDGDVLSYIREGDGSAALIAVNRGEHCASIPLPSQFLNAKNIFGAKPQGDSLNLSPYGYTIITV